MFKSEILGTKVPKKHYTAFNRQVREGVLIVRAAATTAILMNSKSEILGTRIPRKKVEKKGQEIEVMVGDPEKNSIT